MRWLRCCSDANVLEVPRGDVEANPGPGPSNKDILETFLAGQAAIQAEISGIKTELATTVSMLTDLKNIYTQLDKKISEPPSSLETTQHVQSSLNSIASVMTFQSKKLTDLEDRSRRSNLIIHGLEESAGETDETLKAKVVVDVFKSTLGVECK